MKRQSRGTKFGEALGTVLHNAMLNTVDENVKADQDGSDTCIDGE